MQVLSDSTVQFANKINNHTTDDYDNSDEKFGTSSSSSGSFCIDKDGDAIKFMTSFLPVKCTETYVDLTAFLSARKNTECERMFLMAGLY